MKKSILLAVALCASVFASAETVAYIATKPNTPQTGWSGQVLAVQFASTNATGTATVSAITDLSVNGQTVSFTNVLATATLENGIANIAPTNTFVASKQRIVVSGTAFPGGSTTVWIKK